MAAGERIQRGDFPFDVFCYFRFFGMREPRVPKPSFASHVQTSYEYRWEKTIIGLALSMISTNVYIDLIIEIVVPEELSTMFANDQLRSDLGMDFWDRF